MPYIMRFVLYLLLPGVHIEIGQSKAVVGTKLLIITCNIVLSLWIPRLKPRGSMFSHLSHVFHDHYITFSLHWKPSTPSLWHVQCNTERCFAMQ
jgi:hypothetical protein